MRARVIRGVVVAAPPRHPTTQQVPLRRAGPLPSILSAKDPVRLCPRGPAERCPASNWTVR